LVAPATKNIWAFGRFGPLQTATVNEAGDETMSWGDKKVIPDDVGGEGAHQEAQEH
jgi:hypothetical protein